MPTNMFGRIGFAEFGQLAGELPDAAQRFRRLFDAVAGLRFRTVLRRAQAQHVQQFGQIRGVAGVARDGAYGATTLFSGQFGRHQRFRNPPLAAHTTDRGKTLAHGQPVEGHRVTAYVLSLESFLGKEIAMAAIVVVGVDGSPDSSAALRFAADEATQRAARLRVVHVWTPIPWCAGLPEFQQRLLAADRARCAEDAAARTQDAVRELGLLVGRVEALTAEGAPGAALVELSRDARLLVVGATGHGGAPADRVGSTARYVTRHAVCPVTVVSQGRHPVARDEVSCHTVPVAEAAVPAPGVAPLVEARSLR